MGSQDDYSVEGNDEYSDGSQNELKGIFLSLHILDAANIVLQPSYIVYTLATLLRRHL